MNNFVGSGFIKPETCDALVQLYEQSPVKTPGGVSEGDNTVINKSMKDNTEVFLQTTEPALSPYIKELSTVIDKYKKKYVYSTDQQSSWSLNQNIKIQKYLPGQSYHFWHFEKTGVKTYITRHLAFSTFLNHIKDTGACGGTEFYYQKLKMKPKKGLTIIFPAEWTHTHRGIVSHKDTKYLLTGWFTYNPFYINVKIGA
jgi:hypothetical protein